MQISTLLGILISKRKNARIIISQDNEICIATTIWWIISIQLGKYKDAPSIGYLKCLLTSELFYVSLWLFKNFPPIYFFKLTCILALILIFICFVNNFFFISLSSSSSFFSLVFDDTKIGKQVVENKITNYLQCQTKNNRAT